MTIRRELFEASRSWVNTALSSGFRVFEIPFILFYINAEQSQPTAGLDVDIFGIVLAIIVAASGFAIPLTTPASKGAKLSGSLGLLGYALAGYLVFSTALLIGFAAVGGLALGGPDCLLVFALTQAAGLAIAFRRWIQGSLISHNRTEGALYSSLLRIAFTVLCCLVLPRQLGDFRTGLAIIVAAAFVDTISCYLFDRFRRPAIQHQQAAPYSMSPGQFAHITLPGLVYTTQGFILIFLLTQMLAFQEIAAWVVAFSYISIYLGLYLDLESIFARYAFRGLDFLAALVLPLCVGLVLMAMTLAIDAGRLFYFVTFQGLPDLSATAGLSAFVLGIIVSFLVKQGLKGQLMAVDRNRDVGIAGLLNLLGIGGAALYLSQTSSSGIILAGCTLYMSGLIAETAWLAMCAGKLRRGQLSAR